MNDNIKNPILYLGDCIEQMKNISDSSIDFILTDPPYGTTGCKWDFIIPFDEMWEQIWRVLKPGSVCALFGTEPFSSTLRMSQLQFFKYDWVWHKSKCGSAFTAKFRPQQKHEIISIFGKGKTQYFPIMREGTPYVRKRKSHPINNHKIGFGSSYEIETINTGERHPETVIFFQQKWRRQDQVHPTQKPVELLEYLIKTYTKENQTVLDFTMGSGSTGVAAINTNRNFIGIEKDGKYFQIAESRISCC